MTKHVDQAHIEQYLSILYFKYVAGRAIIAQQLHSMGESSRAEPDNVHALDCSAAARSVSQSVGVNPSRGRSQINPISLIESNDVSTIVEQTSELNRQHFESCKMPRPEGDKAAERHVDSWGREGKDGRWTRNHRSARRALFTPFKVAGGPSMKIPMKKIRITRGKFFDGGKTFKIIDDWTVRANAHRMLESSWIGTTDFRESADYIDDDTDEELERKDEDPAKEEPTK